MLPEGELRRLLARETGVKEVREALLLAHVGVDLPGAVRAIPSGVLSPSLDEGAKQAAGSGSRLRFSLAGVQLKFSMLREGTRFTLPMRGRNGNWLVKLPDRRFDRLPDRRVHQEDFAQVFGLYPDQKYDEHNYESIASVILRTAGQEAFHAFVDRLAFVVLSGNADAHHKNWSLRYPDGYTAELSPAYDQVATILYVPEVGDCLALNLARSKEYRDVSLASFQRMGRKLGLDSEAVAQRAREAVRRIRDAWATVRAEVPLTDEQRRKIERHWRRIPLVHEAG